MREIEISRDRFPFLQVLNLLGYVYITGGSTKESGSALVDIVDMASLEVSSGPPMRQARFDHASTASQTGVFGFGGMVNRQLTTSCEIYNPRVRTWSNLPQLSTARCSFTAEVIDSNNVILVGGRCKSGLLNTVELLTRKSASNTWTWRDLAPLLEARRCPGVAFFNDRVIVIGSFGAKTVEILQLPPADSKAEIGQWTTAAPPYICGGKMMLSVSSDRLYAAG